MPKILTKCRLPKTFVGYCTSIIAERISARLWMEYLFSRCCKYILTYVVSRLGMLLIKGLAVHALCLHAIIIWLTFVRVRHNYCWTTILAHVCDGASHYARMRTPSIIILTLSLNKIISAFYLHVTLNLSKCGKYLFASRKQHPLLQIGELLLGDHIGVGLKLSVLIYFRDINNNLERSIPTNMQKARKFWVVWTIIH